MYNGSGDYVVVGVNLGYTLDLVVLEALGIPMSHVLGQPGQPGWALWGWFDADSLDASGRTRTVGSDVFRRPALGSEGFDFAAQLTYCMFDEEGNLDLFVIWSLWGDINDDDQVCQLDLDLLRRYLHLLNVEEVVLGNRVAANVIVDGQICQNDLDLLRRYVHLLGIEPVVLGVLP